MSLNYRNTVLAQSPLAYYTLDEVSGTTYVDIVNANNLTGTGGLTQGVTPPVGLDGFAITSPSQADTITGTITGIPTGVGTAVTITGWVKWDGSTIGTLLFGWDNATDTYFQSTTQYGFNTGAGDCYGFDPTAAGMANTWVHLAVVYYSGQSYVTANKIYVNGVSQTLSQLSGSAGNSQATAIVWMMGWGAGTGNRFVGSLDEIAYFNTELSSGQILAQYNAEISHVNAFANAQATIFHPQGFGQAQADVKATKNAFANAQAKIFHPQGFGQTQADIKVTSRGFANAQGIIFHPQSFAQAQADIKVKNNVFANALATIKITSNGFANAQAKVVHPQSFGQARADIRVIVSKFAQVQARISSPTTGVAQAQAKVIAVNGYFGQAMAFIGHFKYGQAQAFISGLGSRHTGQAKGYILRGPSSTPIDPSNSADVTYLVQFNGYSVPGYLQEETFDSIENNQTYYTVYADNSTTDRLGLANKQITLKEKLIGTSYLDVKNQAQRAAVILNSTRRFARLYIQTFDKYYLAMTRTVAFDQDASAVGKTLDYTVEFEAKPWQFDTITQTLIGSGTLITSGRTIYDGGWTPTTVQVTGTNVTISGYTEHGDFAGYISVSGDVTSLIVDTEASSATIGGLNRSDVINNLDYWLYVGEGVTTFVVTGASDCEITWVNRWHL